MSGREARTTRRAEPSRDPRRTRAHGKLAPRPRDGPRVDRIVVLRALGVVVVLAFLALVVQGAILAFGTGEQQATRIERAVSGTTAPGTAPSR